MCPKETRFEFKLPAGWEDQTAYTFKGPDDGDMSHSIVLVVDRYLQHDNIVSFSREKTTPIQEALQGLEILKDEETSVAECNPSYDFFYKWIPSEEKIIFQKYVFVIADGMGFSFAAQFSKRTLKTVGAMMKKVVEAVLPGTYEPLD